MGVGRATLRDGAGKTTRAENRYRPELTIILDWGQNAPGPHPVRALYVCLCHGITDSEIRDAAAAGCDSMPELMMRYRAATFLIRSVAPEIALGFQTTEEVRDIIDVTSQSQVVGTAPSLDEIAMAAVEETEQPTTTETNEPEPATEQTLFSDEN